MSVDHFHDDLVFHLAKFLHSNDCLSLALSNVNERFPILYGYNRKKLSISEYYFLRNKTWKIFFSAYITPSMITVFDVSHSYWLKAKVLFCCIKKMPNLEELYIQDTRMALKRMPQVFESCQKIVKLSMTLKEDNLDQFQKGVMDETSLNWMIIGFRKITHLKFFAFVVPSGECYNDQAWVVPLGVIKWCKCCIHLLLSLTYKDATDSSSQESGVDNRAFQEEILPHLSWMKKLQSLQILLGSQSQRYLKDEFARTFVLHWLSEIPAESLQRLWVTPSFDDDLLETGLMGDMNSPSVKSIVTNLELQVEEENGDLSVLEQEQFLQLEHLAEIPFDEVEDGLEHLLDLKYVRGFCTDDTEGLNDFCRIHPNLEQLHFILKNRRRTSRHDHFELDGDWNLPLLKILTYCCGSLSQNNMDHLVEACPNIEQLHLDFTTPFSTTETVNILSTIEFQHLTWLTISGNALLDGSYLPLIVEKCPKLERLHIKGSLEAKLFFDNLTKCFSSAPNLRDLRVQWPNYLSNDPCEFVPPFLEALKLCPNFERLVLFAVKVSWDERSFAYSAPLEDSVVKFAKGMPHLVALCLAGFPIDPTIIRQKLVNVIDPNRAAFRLYLGSELPKASDISVPRIHFDGIIDPIQPYYAPPSF